MKTTKHTPPPPPQKIKALIFKQNKTHLQFTTKNSNKQSKTKKTKFLNKKTHIHSHNPKIGKRMYKNIERK